MNLDFLDEFEVMRLFDHIQSWNEIEKEYGLPLRTVVFDDVEAVGAYVATKEYLFGDYHVYFLLMRDGTVRHTCARESKRTPYPIPWSAKRMSLFQSGVEWFQNLFRRRKTL